MPNELPNNLIEIIKDGENINVEFKEAKNELPSNLFETICAMSNRYGGHIFLGIKDNGEISGVNKENIKQIKKDFVNLCNNPEKIFPTIHLELKEYSINSKIILYTYVTESSDVHRTKNKIFDRNEDGDFDITNNTRTISNLYIRKSNSYAENKIFPYATLEDLREDVIDKARKLAVIKNKNHPWKNMNNLELLKSASLYEKDIQTGESGFNLACILLFGKDETIKSAISFYKTDAIFKENEESRYDDREDIRTNLIDSYDILLNFVNKHLNNKFYLEGTQRIDIRDKITREICANILIHREYYNPLPSRITILKDKYLISENPNKPLFIGYIDVNNYTPFPKNPKIAQVFKEIGFAEELGTGIKNIVKYTKIYSGATPTFKEDEIFKVVVPLEKPIEQLSQSNKNKELILKKIKDNPYITQEELSTEIGISLSTVKRIIIELKENNYIERIGSKKNGAWKINKEI